MHELILIIEDEPQIARLARDYLAKNGFRVLVAGDGVSGLAAARRESPDLVLLDLLLPGLDGREVCRRLRAESAVPILMLTALAEDSDQIVGLELGADDYLTKPFSPAVLVARVRAALRRVGTPVERGVDGGNRRWRRGPLTLDEGAHTAVLDGRPLRLTPNEFRLLVALARHAGQTLSREQLLDELHGPDAADLPGFDRSVDSHVKNLRRKLEVAGGDPGLIETVYAVGYRLTAGE
ncbi:MAG: response regulator transcription factor [Candidatus Promineofilum sp.]|nr:response regulator transcription factor [Promineifilum sp.]